MSAIVLENNSIQLVEDRDHVFRLVANRLNNPVNIMDLQFADDFAEAVSWLQKQATVRGLMLESYKDTFFAGGDLNYLSKISEDNSDHLFAMLESIKSSMRIIETLGVPVVACLNGAALGGGWELALCAHHRIAVTNKRYQVGLPEASLGLLPGAGGVTRMVRLFGLEAAVPFLSEGTLISPRQAHAQGWIHQLAEFEDQMTQMAFAFIDAHTESAQPWDKKGYKVPGGLPTQAPLIDKLPIFPAMVSAKTAGRYPSQQHILSAAVEGLMVDFDTATRIETRYFVNLATGRVAKSMINTFFHSRNAINHGANRPKGEAKPIRKIGVMGAGMMGAGIAFVCAQKDIHVVLKDQDVDAAERGKHYSALRFDKLVSKGKMTRDVADQKLANIHIANDFADFYDTDLVIEAVFENQTLKHELLYDAEKEVSDTTIVASNTSTLPITGLASAVNRPENMLGIHFFSPVDRMPLVEIIRGEKTSNDALATAYDFAASLGKLPIVVNDGRGFFTTRVFSTYTREGMQLLSEGVPAILIENLANHQGFPVGPLAVMDEVSLSLMANIRKETEQALALDDIEYQATGADHVLDKMLDAGRAGRNAGAGFYEYHAKSKHLWEGLDDMFTQTPADMPHDDIAERLLFIQALETVHCIEARVVTTARDANIGSVLGVGFPAWTGGTLEFINSYGVKAFVNRAHMLAGQYGERFKPTGLLEQMAENDLLFTDE